MTAKIAKTKTDPGKWVTVSTFMSEEAGKGYHKRLKLQQNSKTKALRTVPAED